MEPVANFGCNDLRNRRCVIAIVDLRNASVFLVDGTTGTGTTTLAADSAAGSTSITLTSASGFAVGDGIQIGSSGQIYEIVSLVSTLAVISPALPFDVSSGDAVTQIGNSVEVKIGEGTLTYSEKRAITYVLNRGKIYTVKLGDDAPVDVSFQFIWEFLRAGSGEPPTVEEALRKIGAASAWVSSSPDTCEPYSVDIIICNLPPCEGQNEIITLPAFRHEDLAHDLKAGTVSVTGKCNVNFARVQHNS